MALNIKKLPEENGSENLNKTFDFCGKRMIFILVSAVIIIAGLVSFIISGFNYGIDLVGGSMIYFDMKKEVTNKEYDDIIKVFKDTTGKIPTIQLIGANKNVVFAKFNKIDEEKLASLGGKLSEKFSLNTEDIRISGDISPNYPVANLAQDFVVAGVVMFAILIYAFIRFGIAGGIAAFICQLHELLLFASILAVLRIEINSAVFYLAMFMILVSAVFMYSLFAKIRTEDKSLTSKNTPFNSIVNKITVLNLPRLVIITVVSLIVIDAVLILGTPMVRSYMLALMAAVIISLYSSICVSGSIWALLRKKKV